MTSKGQVDLNCRESAVVPAEDLVTFADLEVGDVLPAEVTRIEEYGVFCKFRNSQLSGLSHVSELSDDYVEDISKLFGVGDLVKVKVLSKAMDEGKEKVSLGLKASYFVDEDEDEDDEDESGGEGVEEEKEEEEEMDEVTDSEDEDEDEEGVEGIRPMEVSDDEDDGYIESLVKEMDEEEEEEEEEDDDDDDDESDESSSQDDSDDSDSDSEDEGFSFKPPSSDKANAAVSEPKKKKQKMSAAEIDAREAALASGEADANPTTVDDFERLILASPSDSELWMKYMAHHLETTSPDEARKIAQRALRRIPIEMDQERLNVCMAVVALEANFGTDDHVRASIKEAGRRCDREKVYLKAGEILSGRAQSALSAKGVGKEKQAEEAVALADTHFNTKSKEIKPLVSCWLAHMKHLLLTKRSEEANELLKRASQSVVKREHVALAQQFASLEFDYGIKERGRTVFETLISKHPKKLDLWYVLIDKEVKAGSVANANALYKRLTAGSQWSEKQMKGVFKRWYKFAENSGGDVEDVKKMAVAFVEGRS